MKKAEVLERIKGLDEETQKAVVCALVGHSRIVTTFFGYFYCARCETQIGDSLGSTYDANEDVIVGHNCEKCRSNFKACTWKDKLFCPDPFNEELKPLMII